MLHRGAIVLLALCALAPDAPAAPRRRHGSSHRAQPTRRHRARHRARGRTHARASASRSVRAWPHHEAPAEPSVTFQRALVDRAVSPGCDAASAPTGVLEAGITVRGVARSYLLAVPPGYRPGVALPLVFAFHGLTGTPSSLRQYLRLEREAGDEALFVYPAGLRESSPDGTLGHTHWEIEREDDDVAFFDALLEQLGQSYCVDLHRVFAVGHSAGAVVTNALGCQRGDVLRAIAPIAGSGPHTRHCTAPPAVWITHGRADDPVPFFHGETSREYWATAAGCAPLREAIAGSACERYTGCASRAEVRWCPHEGDHGPPAFAAREIWAFFTGLR